MVETSCKHWRTNQICSDNNNTVKPRYTEGLGGASMIRYSEGFGITKCCR